MVAVYLYKLLISRCKITNIKLNKTVTKLRKNFIYLLQIQFASFKMFVSWLLLSLAPEGGTKKKQKSSAFQTISATHRVCYNCMNMDYEPNTNSFVCYQPDSLFISFLFLFSAFFLIFIQTCCKPSHLVFSYLNIIPVDRARQYELRRLKTTFQK